MIKKLKLHGFKSYVDQELDIRPLTVLTGLNSSGKSSIIQAFRVLENVVNREDREMAFHQLNIGDINEVRNLNCEKTEIIASTDDEFKHITKFSTTDAIVVESFPKIIYVSASRKGATATIPIYSDFELGAEGENVLNIIEHYGDTVLDERLQDGAEGKTFDYVLSGWLQKISPGIKFKPKLDRKADVSYSLYNQHRASNVGFGLSYTLPIIVALLLGTIDEDSLVLIENPEAHLHPKGQYEISRLICLCVEAGAKVIVETHSDHLFDGIRIFCKESRSSFYNKVIAYWCQLNEDNCTSVEPCHISNKGNMDHWPKGMFDQFLINAEKLL